MRATLFAFAAVQGFCGGENSSFISGDEDEVGGAKCSLYLAKSTIENAGLGVFTGVQLERGEYIGFGDVSIPIFDLNFHAGASRQKEDYHWLLDEYTWSSSSANPHMETEAELTSAWAPGFGSMPNCHFRLKNVDKTKAEHDTAGILRTDPGVGAFTPYHNSSAYTTDAVEAGSELFVDYGPNWFLTREQDMGLVPLVDSYKEAAIFLDSYQQLVEKTLSMSQGDSESLSSLEGAISDLFDVIKTFPYKSRPLAAIPKSWSTTKHAFEVGIQQTELEQSIRSLDYLDNHGKCLDNIQPGTSNIPHAGRGAFATRFIQKDSYVGISPLAHIPDRDVLNMYADQVDPETYEETRNLSQPIGQQLLLNYCFGYRSSSLLLCPYSSGTPFINHNSKSPNTKLIWSNDPIYNTASWMDEPVSFFDNIWHGGLAFEYVAISDIKPGDEITVDYGPEWEEAWSNHIQRWQSPDDAESYISPQELNEDPSILIPTHDVENPLIWENIDAWCRYSLESVEEDKHIWQEHDMEGDERLVRRIIDRAQLPSDQSYIYTVELVVDIYDEDPEVYRVKDVPRKALFFYHKQYKSDMFIEGVFRHEMMIPDEIFPDAWKNLS